MNTTTESSIYESVDQKSVLFNNTHIIDLSSIIKETVNYIKILDLQDRDIQRLFLHYFILNTCECLKQTKTIKYILYLNLLLPQINEVDYDICLSLLIKALKSLQISYIEYPSDLITFFDKLIKKSDYELILFETKNIKTRNKKSFIKFKKFLKQNGLNFLHDAYFIKPSNKIILFR